MQVTQTSSIEARVIPLAETGNRTREVGAKAARLGALLVAGERVPDGFCVIGSGQTAVALAIEAYHRLGPDVVVAVRSSASGEDGSDTSFAGQFETVLKVRGADALSAALARCWASASGGRAEAYRRKREGSGDEPLDFLAMAVLVQQMVDARAAGVAFSANPLTGARDEVIIEAVPGLGDILVAGEVTADRFTVTNAGKVEARARRIGDLSIDEAEARAIAAMVRRIEAIEGVPQDLEWALDGTELWLLQARPMTALPEAVHWDSPIPGAKWDKDLQAAEWAKEPLSPLGATTTFETMAVARQEWRGWPPVPLARKPDHTLINGWLYMRRDLRPITLLMNVAGAMVTLLVGGFDGHRRVRRTWARHLERLDYLEGAGLSGMPDADLRRHADQLLEELAFWWIEVCFFAAFARGTQMLVGQMRPPGLADPGAPFRGNDSLLLEAQRALRRAAQDPAQVNDYVMRFGHFIESADPIHRTLRESPEHLEWQLIAGRAGTEDPDQRLTRLRSERGEAEKAVRSLRGPRGYAARRALVAGQSFAAHTDDAVYHFQRVLAALRASFLEAGRRLAEGGSVERPEDIFYLESAEIWDGAPSTTLRALVQARRALREQRKRLAPPPFIPRVSDAAWTEDPLMKRIPSEMRAMLLERGLQERDGRRVLVGTPGSPGRARGIARVVTGPADFERFRPGDILVAHATSPIWTPLLGIAAAAVTEVGGPLAHAAIVAREFGIPLVDGAIDATLVIADGTPVLIDGSAGVVEL